MVYIKSIKLGLLCIAQIIGYPVMAEAWPQQMTPNGWYYPTELTWTDNASATWPEGIQNDHQPINDPMSLGRIYGWKEPSYEIDIQTQHMGMDIRAPGNASVYAIGDGVVDRIINTGDPVDDMIAVRHTTAEGTNIWAVYGHCRPRVGISVGAIVAAGQDFAYIIDQANDHIHFGIKLNNNFSTGWGRLALGLDPEAYGWKAPRTFLLNNLPWSGTVSTGTISGYVRDVDGNPIYGATVSTSAGVPDVTSAADGSYSIPDVPPGVHSVTAVNTGYYAQTITGVSVTAGGISTCNFNLLAQPVSILQNGGFESGTADPWIWFGDFDDSDDKIHTGVWHMGIQAHEGAYFVGSAANFDVKNGGLYQDVSATPGQLYKLSAWINTCQTGGFGNSTMSFIGVNPIGGIFGDPQTMFMTPPTWTDSIWKEITVPAVASSWQITVFLGAMQLSPEEWNLNCFDDVTLTPVPAGTIGQIKTYPNGCEVGLVDKIITSGTLETGGGFYLEEMDRSSAIRVVTDQVFQTGARVTLTGILDTVDGERVLHLTSVSERSTGESPASPVLMRCSDAGGASVANGYGLSNVGILIKLLGKVTSTGSDHFYLNDGSLEGEGLKIESVNLTSPPVQNQFVSVTGICRLTGSAGNYRAIVRPRNQNDLVIYQQPTP